jgi:GT2 family glycosyltransferase
MAERRDVAICSSRIMVYEQPGIIGGDGNEAHFIGMPTQRNAGSLMSENSTYEAREVGATGGASLLIDKSRIESMPCFDPDFFYNFEELDFCLRNRMAGHRCLVVPQSIVHHKYLTGGVAGLSSSEVQYSSKRAFYVFRNRWLVILKLYALRTIIVIAPALLLFELVTILFAIRRRSVTPYLQAWASLIRNRRSIREKRRAIQAARTVRDRVLLSAYPLTLGRATIQSGFEGRVVAVLNCILHSYWSVVRLFLAG